MSSTKKLYWLKKSRLNKNVQWAHDFDYLAELSPRERTWMNKFIKEYYDGSVKKGDRTALHKTVKLRRDCYQRKNFQNNDVNSIQDAYGNMDRVNEETEREDS